MTLAHTFKLALLTSTAAALFSTNAMALEAQAFLDRVQQAYAPYGYNIVFGAAALDGDTITVDGLTVALKMGAEVGEPMAIDTDVVFTGVTELDDGGYAAATISVPDVDTTFTDEGKTGHFTLADITVGDFYVPGPSDTPSTIDLIQAFGSFAAGPLNLTINDKQVLALDSIASESTFNPEQGTKDLIDVTSTFQIAGLAADLSSIEDPQAAAAIQALELTNITGDLDQSMKWTMADGRLTIDQSLLTLDDLGSLNMKFDLSGYTPAVMDKIFASQAAMAAKPAATPEETSAAEMAMGMEIAQNITIHSASVRYEDVSLVGKALQLVAGAQGIEPAQLVEGLKASLPQMLAATGVPELNTMITTAANTFLDDPQSLEASVAPAEPVNMLVLAAAATNPAGLIKLLGVAITANAAAR